MQQYISFELTEVLFTVRLVK